MPLLPLLLFFLFFFGGMFLLVIFQAKRHREALALIATQQRAMQAELARLADLLEALVVEHPLEEAESGGLSAFGTDRPESPDEDASFVPGLEMMLSRGGETVPAEADDTGTAADGEKRGSAPARLSLGGDIEAPRDDRSVGGRGMPELKL